MSGIEEVLVHTGQHFDNNMSQVFFDELGICAPKYYLAISGGTHGAQTARMLEAVEHVLKEEEPSAVLVYGDTNSTLAGALAASKLNIPVIHIEAGLRSFNRRMPEEINRVITDHLSSLLFAPTGVGLRNLKQEGISSENCFCIGDVMYDASIIFGTQAEATSSILDKLGLIRQNYLLATIHRAENTDEASRLAAIFEALSDLAKDVPLVLPLHPRTRQIVEAHGLIDSRGPEENFFIIEPVGYLDMIMLEKNASLIITDSGGVQKEAFFYEVPCVTLRDETEWTELVELGWNTLVSPAVGSHGIARVIREAIGVKGVTGNPYGSGNAGQKIVEEIGRRYSRLQVF